MLAFKIDRRSMITPLGIVKTVSKRLHNTAKVCRNYYIHPVILETYQKDILIPHFEDIYKNYNRDKNEITRDEYATISLLRKYS